jgi:hypothetical protein
VGLREFIFSVVYLPQEIAQLRQNLATLGLTAPTDSALQVPSLAFQYDLQNVLTSSIGGEDGAKAFWLPPGASVPRIDATTLTPLDFHRRYVSKNTPVILTNAMNDVRCALSCLPIAMIDSLLLFPECRAVACTHQVVGCFVSDCSL